MYFIGFNQINNNNYSFGKKYKDIEYLEWSNEELECSTDNKN